MSILSNKVRVGLGITVAAVSLTALPASAAQAAAGEQHASKQENIGVLTGAAVGAAAGGPIGAMVGIVAGALLGHHYHQQSVANRSLAVQNHDLAAQNQALSASLGQSEHEREGLAGKLSVTTQSLASIQAQRAELDRTVQLSDDIETDVVFKTADASINSLELPALNRIGALAASLPPGAKVRVDGYADPRGPATLNDDLSLQRAEAVAVALQKAGVPQDRLVVAGHGSSQSTSPQGDLDAYAFDRRVTVRLQGAPAVAGTSGVGASGPEVADATPAASGSP
ncbi:MAG TPA: OmpA family protein [Steroidobacteraceae bacterium]|nr:OmpA family protein [Steroidobacteraceae bacterium]